MDCVHEWEVEDARLAVCRKCDRRLHWNALVVQPRLLVSTKPPSPETMKRAEAIAREQGWLTDDGFIWE